MNDALDAFRAALNKSLFGQEKAKKGHCIRCKKGPIGDHTFRDTLAMQEFRITHLCQACQDIVFAPEEE